MKSKHAAALALLALMVTTSPEAWAQKVYRCTSGKTTVLSDRPCPDADITQQQPLKVAPASDSSTAMRLGAEQFLNPACAELYEALRNANTRGLSYDRQADLHKEFRLKCAEDARQANQRYLRAAIKAQEESRAQQAAQQREKDAETALRDQCGELRRILADRRKRVDSMTPGERADLERSEQNYSARCAKGS